MNDLRPTITPKSDQLNADDLIGGPRTITITKVLLTGSDDQPVAIHFEGDNGKPYKPCKTMRRLLVSVWGPDGNAFAGRAMTIYRDNTVSFGNAPVGGIRISHVSGINQPMTIPLTERRAQRKPYTVQPLAQAQQAPAAPAIDTDALERAARDVATRGEAALREHWQSLPPAHQKALVPIKDDLKAIAARAAPPPSDHNPEDPFGLPPLDDAPAQPPAINGLPKVTVRLDGDGNEDWRKFVDDFAAVLGTLRDAAAREAMVEAHAGPLANLQHAAPDLYAEVLGANFTD